MALSSLTRGKDDVKYHLCKTYKATIILLNGIGPVRCA